jgi:hypothetical protein
VLTAIALTVNATDVRSVPEANIAPLFDYFVGLRNQRRTNREPECFRRLEINYELKFGRPFNGISAGLAPLKTLSTKPALRR